MKPFRNLIFLLSVFLLLLVLAIVFPEDGILLGEDVRLRFADAERLFSRDTTGNAYADSLVGTISVTDDPEFDASDTLLHAGMGGYLFDEMLSDSLAFKQDSIRQARLDSIVRVRIDSLSGTVFPLEISAEGEQRLMKFFERAALAGTGDRPLRILHYGDSQIENDRMSALIRYRLQKVFGGSGCGMVPAIPLYSGNPVFRETHRGEWNRYTGFGKRDTTIGHNSYGAMVCFTSVPQPVESSLPSLRFEFIPGKRASRFDQIRLFMHAYSDSGFVAVHLSDTLSDTLRHIAGGYQVIELENSHGALDVEMEFNLPGGGRVYGISFDAEAGIQVDNMAMRGSSGLEFSKIDRTLLEEMFTHMDPGLIVLQFGGNVVPYIENTAYYGKTFARELNVIKGLLPDVPVVVIGPADMSLKDNGKFTTYSTVEPVRDALRKAALDAGYAFWDMYEAMGGRNSMPTFVMADPPLASTDYIHLTPRGANFMAEMFVKALLKEYASDF